MKEKISNNRECVQLKRTLPIKKTVANLKTSLPIKETVAN